jgi:hypothetical protein
LYPNPSAGFFKLNADTKMAEISVYNYSGEKVYSSIVNSNEGTLSLDQPDGIYFVQIKTDAGVLNKKIVVQH